MTLFLLGIAISIPISVLSPFITTRVQKFASTRSLKQAQIRKLALEAELQRVGRFEANRTATLIYIGTRLVLINTFWLAQEGIDSLFGLFANGTQTIAVADHHIEINVNTITTYSSAVASLVAAILISLIVRYGIVAARLLRKLDDFDAYKASVEAEIMSLEKRIGADKPHATQELD